MKHDEPMTRESLIHVAKVYLTEARRRTGKDRWFQFTLLNWAADARRKAMALSRPAEQMQLFG